MPPRSPNKEGIPTARPSVFQYLDAREFLAAACEHAKTLNPNFSHRFVANAMGARSSGFLKDILNGRVRLSPERAVKFAQLLRLTRAEAERFELLALYALARTEHEKERILSRMGRSGSPRRASVLEASRLEYFGKWRYAAVRELLALHDFREDYAALGAMLDPPITGDEAREAVQLLLRLKLIRKNAQGGYERTDKIIRSGPDQAASVKPALRDNLHLALRALEGLPPSARPFSYLTLSVSEESVAVIREHLAELRGELLEIAARDEKADRLYQINIQVFPLSRIVRRDNS